MYRGIHFCVGTKHCQSAENTEPRMEHRRNTNSDPARSRLRNKANLTAENAETAESFHHSLICLSATSAPSAVQHLFHLFCAILYLLSSILHLPSSIFPCPSITRPLFNFDKTESAYLFQIENTGKNRTHLPRKADAFRARRARFCEKFRANRPDFSVRGSAWERAGLRALSAVQCSHLGPPRWGLGAPRATGV